ncbi:MAG: type II secretion system minor pseudopilin GspK [Pseudomonadota bacterium]
MRRQQGAVAIVFSLLITTLIISVITKLAYDVTLQTRRTQSLLWQEQARLFAIGAESWIGDILRQDLNDTENDHFGELWAQELPPLPVEGVGIEGVVAGALIDLQGRFNLNNLMDADGAPVEIELERFRRLLGALELDPQIAEAVMDWSDNDTEPRFPGGGEDEIYTNRLPPLRVPNLAFRSTAELAMVEGLTPDVLPQLLPHVAALPERTALNVNTATQLILQTLDENISGADVERVMEERAEIGIEDPSVTFAGILSDESIETLDTQTRYFQLRSVVRIGTIRFTMYSVLYRTEQGQVAVIQRSFGSPP